MKHILVPVDFSAEAANAAHFAAQLAKQLDAELTLLYVFNLPVRLTEVPYQAAFSRQDLENEEMLDDLSQELELRHGVQALKLNVMGYAVDQIVELTLNSVFDLIVLGMKGAGEKLSYLIGSTATEVMRRSLVPVLAVPGNSRFKIPKLILLACDFQQVNHPDIFQMLMSLCRRFESEIALLNVFKPGELPVRKKAVEGIRLERYLDGINYHFDFEEQENVELGVDNYLCSHPSDMLVIVPHEHNLVERLFQKAHSKRLMLHATIPVLALPDTLIGPQMKSHPAE
jgi:nucleotide-binding universal stress UspA family protein